MAVLAGGHTAQVVGYVERSLKDRVDRIRRQDRRMSMSRVIEDALRSYVPTLEKHIKPQPR